MSALKSTLDKMDGRFDLAKYSKPEYTEQKLSKLKQKKN